MLFADADRTKITGFNNQLNGYGFDFRATLMKITTLSVTFRWYADKPLTMLNTTVELH